MRRVETQQDGGNEILATCDPATRGYEREKYFLWIRGALGNLKSFFTGFFVRSGLGVSVYDDLRSHRDSIFS